MDTKPSVMYAVYNILWLCEVDCALLLRAEALYESSNIFGPLIKPPLSTAFPEPASKKAGMRIIIAICGVSSA